MINPRTAKHLPIYILSLVIFAVIAPFNLSAQTSADSYTVLAPLPCIESPASTYIDSSGVEQTIPAITCGGTGTLQTKVSFRTYVQTTINLLIALSAVVAVVMIVWGGLEYMTSVSIDGKSSGKDRITNAIYGLILILCSYIIIRTVDPRFVNIPNTLVPQIVLKADLTKVNEVDVNVIEAYQDEYATKRVEIGQQLQETAKSIKEAQDKLNEINSKLLEMDKQNVAKDDPARNALLLQKSQLENKIKAEQAIQRQQLANSTFNGIISSSLTEITNVSDAENGLSELRSSPSDLHKLVVKLNENTTSIDVQRTKQVSLAHANGDYDDFKINMEAEYSKAVIRMMTTGLIIDTRSVSGISSSGIGGGAGQTITMEKPDGSGRMFWPDAKKIIQATIDEAEVVNKTITDEKLKADLAKKIEVVKEKLGKVGLN